MSRILRYQEDRNLQRKCLSQTVDIWYADCRPLRIPKKTQKSALLSADLQLYRRRYLYSTLPWRSVRRSEHDEPKVSMFSGKANLEQRRTTLSIHAPFAFRAYIPLFVTTLTIAYTCLSCPGDSPLSARPVNPGRDLLSSGQSATAAEPGRCGQDTNRALQKVV